MPISKINGIDINKITKIGKAHRNDLLKLGGAYVRSYQVVSGPISWANTYLDITCNNAFAWLNGVDLSPYQDGNYDLIIYDSTGKQIRGRIKAEAPSGENYDVELVQNPGLETGTTFGWTNTQNATVLVETDPHTGTYNLLITATAPTWGNSRQVVYLIAGAHYVCSAWEKNGTYGGVFAIYDSINWLISSYVSNVGSYGQVTLHFVERTCNYSLVMACDSGYSIGLNVKYDDFSLKKLLDVPSTGVHIIGNGEDYTTYTEVDTGGFISKTSDTITIANCPTRSIPDAYLYKDMGVNFFSGDFIIEFEYQHVSGQDWYIYPVWCALTNDIDDIKGLYDGSKSFLYINTYISGPSVSLYLIETYSGIGYNTTAFSATINTNYYVTLSRLCNVGANGTIYMDVYSDQQKTIKVNHQELALHANLSYRYLFGFNTYNTAWPITQNKVSAVIKNHKVVAPKISNFNTRRWERMDKNFNYLDYSNYTYEVRRI